MSGQCQDIANQTHVKFKLLLSNHYAINHYAINHYAITTLSS